MNPPLVFYLVYWIDLALALVVTGLAAWAFVDCLTKAPVQFQRAFKRTKGFWLALTGGSLVVTALTLLLGSPSLIILLVAGTAVGVYLADVRPAVGLESKGSSSW
ncbi:hypothetical protein GCM10011374_25290 [Kocuria dechangensis]|uniref:DUF2516 family protein n=1 Tax=Kocuria dechangensis TaxID=1176249 RepID=A0A917GZ31_9MICC|nr:DUF2516 family protein [Kocuria dechangensis]GGG61245.1 hypothetical protein GCM10011374_25290 [Kocuria dechangensis]